MDKNIKPEKVDKALAKSVLKDERRQLSYAKKQEKEKNKELKKQEKAKLKEIIKQRKLEDKQTRAAQEELIRELEKRGKFASWLRLDNAASIYPSATKKDWNFVFRISVNMKNKVDEVALQNAVDDILPRFPSFNVRLIHGFFWNYYERNFARLLVEKETLFPCQPFNLNDASGFLIRVLYSDYKIIVEVFHAITDGTGALFFTNSLVARYLERKGRVIKEFTNSSSYLDIPSDIEVEDSFFAHATHEKLKRPKEHPAYKIKGTLLPSGMVNSTEGEMSVKALKELAKKYDVTLTQFLAAVVGFCLNKKRKNAKKPIRISIPINLRSRFSSKTLRNFSSYVNVEITGDNLEFEDVIKVFKTALNQIDEKLLQANINANVNLQKNFFVKIMPLFMKNVVMKIAFNYMGENYQTLAFSNLGKVSAPAEFEGEVDSYSVNLGRSMHNEKSIGIISYGDKLNMCISSKIAENETERDIFSFLSSLGIDVNVYSNRRDLYGSK